MESHTVLIFPHETRLPSVHDKHGLGIIDSVIHVVHIFVYSPHVC